MVLGYYGTEGIHHHEINAIELIKEWLWYVWPHMREDI